MTRKERDAMFARMNPKDQAAYLDLLKVIYASLLVNGKEKTMALINGDGQTEQSRIDATCAELLEEVNI